MGFEEVAAAHAKFLSDHVMGEAIEYRSWPGTMWRSIRGVVDRRPLDQTDNFLGKTIAVSVSKTSVPEVILMKDEVRLTIDKRPDLQAPAYKVVSTGNAPGHWLLFCERKS